MPQMPAICATCGTLFPSGMTFENCSNVMLVDSMTGPCPTCGGTGENGGFLKVRPQTGAGKVTSHGGALAMACRCHLLA